MLPSMGLGPGRDPAAGDAHAGDLRGRRCLPLLLTAVGTPWAVITFIGFARVRVRYDADAPQVCNRRARGGLYWCRGGGNVRAAVA